MDEAMMQAVNLASYRFLHDLFKADGGCCTVCSIYYTIKSMDPKYIGPPPGDSCSDSVRCREHARARLKTLTREQIHELREIAE
jgi:hypothetical protein